MGPSPARRFAVTKVLTAAGVLAANCRKNQKPEKFKKI